MARNYPLKVEIAGSNRARVTRFSISIPPREGSFLMAAGMHCTSNCTNQCAVACTAHTRCTRTPAVAVSAPSSAADECRRRLVAVQRPRVRPESELLQPALQRCAVDAHEVAPVATDHREARLAGWADGP